MEGENDERVQYDYVQRENDEIKRIVDELITDPNAEAKIRRLAEDLKKHPCAECSKQPENHNYCTQCGRYLKGGNKKQSKRASKKMHKKHTKRTHKNRKTTKRR